MGIGDWLIEKIENAGESICDSVEDTGRKIARRGDALFGCEEYENASVQDRFRGFNGTFKTQILKTEIGIIPGDIISVSRGIYDHYGVYINKDITISYTSDKSDIGDNIIQATSFERFLRDATEYSVLVFPDKHGMPDKVRFPSLASSSFAGINRISIFSFLKTVKYKLYSSHETIARAKSRLGEDQYSLIFNNCEHFAIWCKTGIKESHQVNSLLKVIKPISYTSLKN